MLTLQQIQTLEVANLETLYYILKQHCPFKYHQQTWTGAHADRLPGNSAESQEEKSDSSFASSWRGHLVTSKHIHLSYHKSFLKLN